MIQLANDPNASRAFSRSTQVPGKIEAADPRRARSGHPWPFLSRQAERPVGQESRNKPAATESGS